MTTRTAVASWLQPVLAWRDALPASCACAVVFPGYRPDLVQTMASALETRLIDFRKQKMAPLGWQASNLAPHALTETALAEMAHGRDVMLHNAEAMLSLFTREVREAWFAEAAAQDWPQRLILPLTLFAHDLPAQMIDHVIELTAADLPSEGLLQRLAGLA